MLLTDNRARAAVPLARMHEEQTAPLARIPEQRGAHETGKSNRTMAESEQERDCLHLQVAGAQERDVNTLLAELDGLEELAQKTEGYTGADLENLVRKAGLQALRSDPEVKEVAMSFFRDALEDSRRSVTPEMEEEYRKTAERLRRESFRASRRIGFATPTEGE